jgi:hypothetical protein
VSLLRSDSSLAGFEKLTGGREYVCAMLVDPSRCAEYLRMGRKVSVQSTLYICIRLVYRCHGAQR